MTYATRAEILGNLGTALEAPVLAYVTGSRPNAETAISHDQIPLFPRHLEAIGKSERLALLIYTRGGDTNVPWPVVNFIREHCDRLIAVVPFYALSSGTLLTLGADEIQMSRYASLSPIDPTVANAFNPVDPANPGARVAIAVEDVLAYLELAEQTGGVGEKAAAFARLSESLHPLALGNVQRSINMIRQLARQLLALRGTSLGVDETEKLITRFTTEFYSHMHLINRTEALQHGLPVVTPTEPVEALMLDYYRELCTDMLLLEPFNAAAMLRAASVPGAPLPTVPVRLERAYIETTHTCDAFVSEGQIEHRAIPGPPGAPVQQGIAYEVFTEEWHAVS